MKKSDLNKRVIYQQQSGVLAVLIPCMCDLTLTQVAEKDVPTGVPYLIVNKSDLPENRNNRELWSADFSTPDGMGE